MKKTRVAVWGITDEIWKVISCEIDFRQVEIVLFIDSDEMKQGICFENIPITAPTIEQFCKYRIDIYLVAALSAYEGIKEKLIHMGVSKERIQPFVTEDISKYCLGMLDDLDMDFLKKAYFEPSKMIELVTHYKEKYAAHLQRKFDKTGISDWYDKGTLISHACGGVVDGNKMMYTNSGEAFAYTIRSKFKLMECDVLQLNDGELVLGHTYAELNEMQKRYTVLTLKDFMAELEKHEEISCLFDVKWDGYDDYRYVVNEIENMIETIGKDKESKAALKSQIVMEVYDEETIKLAKEKNFKMFFTLYKTLMVKKYLDIVDLCCRYDIGAIGVWYCDERLIKMCRNAGIKVFIYSTDSLNEYTQWRKAGISGVFTNYLRPMETV